jgi:hypothetical protein
MGREGGRCLPSRLSGRSPVQSYLVESFVPRARAADVEEASRRARVAAGELSRAGEAITYVRTTFLPEDETCFHVFEARSADVVEAVARRAGLGRVRIVAAVEAFEQPEP